jgi:hypothetical protein
MNAMLEKSFNARREPLVFMTFATSPGLLIPAALAGSGAYRESARAVRFLSGLMLARPFHDEFAGRRIPDG